MSSRLPLLQAKSLKLRAEDSVDLRIIGACLQDALFPATSIYFSKEDETLTILANRFCWEREPIEHNGTPLYYRTHTGLHFSHIHRVRYQKLNLQDSSQVLSLLTLHGDIKGEIHLQFSGGINLCLHSDRIRCCLHDVHEPWYTPQRPHHFWADLFKP